MTECNGELFGFLPEKRLKVEVDFSGGEVTSDGGVVLLRELDRTLGLTAAAADCFVDRRNPVMIEHTILEMVRQRVFGIAHGYEDLNDHDTLRHDTAFQLAAGKVEPLASSPTLHRLENRSDRRLAVKLHEVIVEQFIRSFDKAPDELILDFDATDDIVHGHQEGRFFHGYYDNYCFLPLYVFCGEKLLVSYLRPSNIDGAKHSWAILALLVRRLRQQWPNVRIIVRGDSGFCRHPMFDWCERHNVKYITGLAKNTVLKKHLKEAMAQAKSAYEATAEKQRVFTEFTYEAGTWKHKRHVIGKAEHCEKGENPRFIVTNLEGDPQALYEQIYCARGDMENRIKEQQLDLFADRTSCHKWWANQLRLLLSSFAYILLQNLRETALKATELATAQMATIRLKLLRIGGVIIKNTRRVKLLLSSHYPYQNLFKHIAHKLRLPIPLVT
jgi:hypothetical protein